MEGKRESGLLYEKLTHEIIGAAMEVHRNLGPGFSERIYEKALKIELAERKVPFDTQRRIRISYKGCKIGDQILDIVVDDKIIIELKATDSLNTFYEAQLISYLKATKCQIGLLINFSKPSLEWKRIKLKDELLRQD